MKKFFRQIIEVEVLCENTPLEWDNLQDVHRAIMDDCDGMMRETLHEEITAQRAADLLIEHGSEPRFFGIETDDDGKVIEKNDEETIEP